MAAMDLQCPLVHGEGRWVQEEAVLLERFDAERKEWESQLKDMQKNIEELYNEVTARRKEKTSGLDGRIQESFLCKAEKSSQFASPRLPHIGYYDHPNHHSNGISNHLNGSGNAGSIPLPNGCSKDSYDAVGYHSNGYSCPNQYNNGCSHLADHNNHGKRGSVEVELENILHSCLGQGLKHVPSSCGQNTFISATNGCQSTKHSQPHHDCHNNAREMNTGLVNTALKDIARVCEDLSSYQDVIRKKSSDKRSEGDSVCFEEVENMKNKQPSWGIQWQDNRVTAGRSTNMADVGVKHSSCSTEAPPIPPRTLSWNLNKSNSPEPHMPVQESVSNKKSTSPCVLANRKCTSPSILRKFEAMLHENEGKVLMDSGVISSMVPIDFKGNTGSFHCRVGNNKSLAFVPVQKWPPGASTLAGEINCRPADSQKFHRGQIQPTDRVTVVNSIPLDFKDSSNGQRRSPGQKGVGKGFEVEKVGVPDMDVKPKGVNSYPPIQSVESNEDSQSMALARESRIEAVNEKAFKSTAPASHTQFTDLLYSCRGEEPSLQGSDRPQQNQTWRLNGSGQYDDFVELLGILGIEHQYDAAKTHLMQPCQQEIPQERQKSSVSVKKGFSRPARPANQRPPSRWANRVPSFPATHATPFSDPGCKETVNPYSSQIETVIM